MQAPAPPPPQTSNQTEAQLFAQNMKDVFFEYDSYDISPQYQQVLQADARFLQQHPNMKFTIEGHCDERGSTEYNLALGDNRANSTKQALARWAFRRTAFAPSATARRSRSAPRAPSPAGRRTGARILCISSSEG